MQIKIKNSSDLPYPCYAKPGDAGMDVYSTEDILIPPGETRLIPTGISLEIPEGYEIQVRPRSGISLKTKLRVANAPGTIDSGYRGEIKVIVDNISRDYITIYWEGYTIQPMKTEILSHTLDIEGNHIHITGFSDMNSNHGYYQIKKGDKIAQIVLVKHEIIEWDKTEELSGSERNNNGFGSTGV